METDCGFHQDNIVIIFLVTVSFPQKANVLCAFVADPDFAVCSVFPNCWLTLSLGECLTFFFFLFRGGRGEFCSNIKLIGKRKQIGLGAGDNSTSQFRSLLCLSYCTHPSHWVSYLTCMRLTEQDTWPGWVSTIQTAAGSKKISGSVQRHLSCAKQEAECGWVWSVFMFGRWWLNFFHSCRRAEM